MSGKGDKPRPKSVDDETYGSNWDRIFSQGEGKWQTQDKSSKSLQEAPTSDPPQKSSS